MAGRKITLLAAGCLLSLQGAHAAERRDYQTSTGPLTLNFNDSGGVSGSYPGQDPKLRGSITGKVVGYEIHAYWYQPYANKRCSSARNNSVFWGTVYWAMQPNGNITGSWAHCNDRPGSGGQWNGTLTRTTAARPPAAAPPAAAPRPNGVTQGNWVSDFGPMAMSLDAQGVVKGSYSKFQGTIRGTFKDGWVRAIWMQPQSAKRCSKPRGQTYYWGSVHWKVMPDASWQGKWAYCDDAQGSGGQWNAHPN